MAEYEKRESERHAYFLGRSDATGKHRVEERYPQATDPRKPKSVTLRTGTWERHKGMWRTIDGFSGAVHPPCATADDCKALLAYYEQEGKP